MSIKYTINILATLLLLFVSPALADTEVRIENELYRVSVGAAGGSFTVASVPSGKTFLTGGKLSGKGGTAKVSELDYVIFGKSKCIEITYPDGNQDLVALCPGVPFVLFRSTLHNRGAEPIVLNHVPSVSADVDLGKPPANLRTLGTGGLLEPARNPGSYAFLAVVDTQSRSGVVGGWLTHDRGSGVVFSPVKDNVVRLQSQLDYGRLRIEPGDDTVTETFAVGYFDDARLGLEAYADAIAKVYSIKLPPQRAGYCTWYMEKHAGSSDEKSLAELSQYAAKNLKPFGFDFIQIDDGWQEGIGGNGPCKNFTTHRPNGPYPFGHEGHGGEHHKARLDPGHLVHAVRGNVERPALQGPSGVVREGAGRQAVRDRLGRHLPGHDPAGARQYVEDVVGRIAHDWGYRLFKMDGFWTGSATRQIYVNDGYRDDHIGEAVFSDPDKTNIEALRDGVKLVRKTAGPKVFLLGCCVSQNMRSFGGSFGLLDAMRVGPDTGAGQIGAPHASRLWFLNGRVWWNDPDCVSVRASMPLEQARLNASFTAIAGDLFYNSDWMPDFPADRLDILRRCLPAHVLRSRPVDVFENEPARIWHLPDTRGPQRRDVVALYNWGNGPLTISCPVERIGLPPAKEYVAFDFWTNKFLPPFKDLVRADLPPGGSCRISGHSPGL